MSRLALVAGTAAALLACAGAAGGATGTPRSAPHASPGVVVNDQFRTGLVRPARLQLFVRDDLSRVRWSSWGGPTATGRGYLSLTRSPTSRRLYATTVTLSRVRPCGGRRVYSALTYRFDEPFPGQGRTARARFVAADCSLGGFAS